MFWHLCACLFFSLQDKGEMALCCTLDLVAGGCFWCQFGADFLAVQSLFEQWSSGLGQGLEHAAFDPKHTHQQSCPKFIGNFVFLEVILEL